MIRWLWRRFLCPIGWHWTIRVDYVTGETELYCRYCDWDPEE